eukprot:gene8759-6161_t
MLSEAVVLMALSFRLTSLFTLFFLYFFFYVVPPYYLFSFTSHRVYELTRIRIILEYFVDATRSSFDHHLFFFTKKDFFFSVHFFFLFRAFSLFTHSYPLLDPSSVRWAGEVEFTKCLLAVWRTVCARRSVPLNAERSFSRCAKGLSAPSSMYGAGESLLLSPLPFVPRQRSVRFAGDDADQNGSPFEREERPTHPTLSELGAGAPPSCTSRPTSPVPPQAAGAASRHGSRSPRPAALVACSCAGTGRRTRSVSRQRLRARRREAQLHYAFYEDSFVENFMQEAKAELASEEEVARREEEQRRATAQAKRTTDETSSLRDLQRVRETLLAAVQRAASRSPPPPPHHRSSSASDDASSGRQLLQRLEEDPDPKVQAALQQLEQLNVSAVKPAKGSSKVARGRRTTASVPLVSSDVPPAATSGRSRTVTRGGGGSSSRSRRAKLESIVDRILGAQATSRSKQSVVVINWPGEEGESGTQELASSGSDADVAAYDCSEEEEVEETREKERRVALRRRQPPPPPTAPVGSKRHRSASVSLAKGYEQPAVVVSRRRRLAAAAGGGRSRQGTSMSYRREVSEVPVLSDDDEAGAEPADVDFEVEDQLPRQLPRRRPATTAPPPLDAGTGTGPRRRGGRGAGPGLTRRRDVDEEDLDDPLLNGSLDFSMSDGRAIPPPSPRRLAHSPTGAGRGRVPRRGRGGAGGVPPPRSTSRSLNYSLERERSTSFPIQAHDHEEGPAPLRQGRRGAQGQRARPGAHPMDVFFNAAFVDPKEFDNLLQNAGGLSVTRPRKANQPTTLGQRILGGQGDPSRPQNIPKKPKPHATQCVRSFVLLSLDPPTLLPSPYTLSVIASTIMLFYFLLYSTTLPHHQGDAFKNSLVPMWADMPTLEDVRNGREEARGIAAVLLFHAAPCSALPSLSLFLSLFSSFLSLLRALFLFVALTNFLFPTHIYTTFIFIFVTAPTPTTKKTTRTQQGEQSEESDIKRLPVANGKEHVLTTDISLSILPTRKKKREGEQPALTDPLHISIYIRKQLLISMSEYTAILVPPEFRDAVLHGAAETIVRRVTLPAEDAPSPRTTEPTSSTTYHLHLFDEEERLQQLQLETLPPAVRVAHSAYTARLNEAREIVRSDPRLSRWLTCRTEAALWPAAALLQEAVEVVAMLKELADDPPDHRGAAALLEAVQVLRDEATLPGLYPLAPAQVAGTLTAFQIQTPPAAAGTPCVLSHARSLGLRGDMLHRLLSDVQVLTSSEVADLPLTSKAVGQLAALLQPHRRHLLDGCYLQLMGTVQEMLRCWGATKAEEHIASRLHTAKNEGRCVRLHVGVYATVIHQPMLAVAFVRAERGRLEHVSAGGKSYTLAGDARAVLEKVLDKAQQAQLEEQLHMPLAEATERGIIRVVVQQTLGPVPADAPLPAAADVEHAVRSYVLSPAVDKESWRERCSCQSLLTTTSADGAATVPAAVCVYRMRVKWNPFVVFHGSRVEGGCVGRHEVLAGFKRQRDEILDARAEEALLQSLRRQPASPSQGAGPSSPTYGASSPVLPACTLVGAELQQAVESAVVRVLSVEPLSKAELLSHSAMRQFAGSPHFDPVVRAVLKKRAQYRARKYELVERTADSTLLYGVQILIVPPLGPWVGSLQLLNFFFSLSLSLFFFLSGNGSMDANICNILICIQYFPVTWRSASTRQRGKPVRIRISTSILFPHPILCAGG